MNKYVVAIGSALIGAVATVLVKKLRDDARTNNTTWELLEAKKSADEAVLPLNDLKITKITSNDAEKPESKQTTSKITNIK